MGLEVSLSVCSKSRLMDLINLGANYYPVGHHALDVDFLEWLYLKNPHGPAWLVTCEEGDELIGVIALIPVVIQTEAGPQRGCYAVNVLTHPAHRGKNLFVKMISCAKSWLSENDVWLLGHPNKSATPGWVRQKMEFKTSLRMFLTKPGSIGFSVGHVTRVEQLDEIPAAFWSGLNYRRDIHIRYTRELIAWRFCEAPHRKYSVSMVSRNGEFYGLRITRQLKGPVHLLIDAVASLDNLSAVLSCGVLPVLHLHSGEGLSGVEVERACWRLPINRRFPFFLSKWSGHNDIDASGISLSASDF